MSVHSRSDDYTEPWGVPPNDVPPALRDYCADPCPLSREHSCTLPSGHEGAHNHRVTDQGGEHTWRMVVQADHDELQVTEYQEIDRDHITLSLKFSGAEQP